MILHCYVTQGRISTLGMDGYIQLAGYPALMLDRIPFRPVIWQMPDIEFDIRPGTGNHGRIYSQIHLYNRHMVHLDTGYMVIWSDIYTTCPGSSDPFYIVTLLYKMGDYVLDTQYIRP